MSNNVKPIPDGYTTVTPYIFVRDAAKALEFYKKAFGAKEIGRLMMADKVGHSEMLIGNSHVMLAEENKEWGHLSPETLNGTAVLLAIYVEDADSAFQKALDAGCKQHGDMGVKDQFYGDRSGTVIDPFGYAWTICTHIEDVTWEEMQKRSDAMMEKAQQS